MNFAHNKVKISHVFRAVFLGKKNILISFSQGLKQGIVCAKVQAKIAPHISVLFAHHFSPVLP